MKTLYFKKATEMYNFIDSIMDTLEYFIDEELTDGRWRLMYKEKEDWKIFLFLLLNIKRKQR